MFSLFKKRAVAAPEARESAAQILIAVAEDSLTAAEGLKRFESISKMFPDSGAGEDRLMNESWHVLSHYDADSDIRERDSEYAIAQKAGLRSLANRVRADK